MTTAAAGSMKIQMISVDTTAAVKRISDEQESDGLRSYLDEAPTLISSDLLETEPRRIGIRHGIDQVLITTIVDGVSWSRLRGTSSAKRVCTRRSACAVSMVCTSLAHSLSKLRRS